MNDQSLKSYYHPPSIVRVVQEHIGQCKNLALILDKYVERKAIDENKERGPWMRDLLQGQVIDAELARSAYQRWRLMLKSLDVVSFDAELEWRIVVGLGGESVLETDLTLHHLYGLPIIPASALKGLTRAYVAGEEKDYFVPITKPIAERKPSLEERTDHPDVQRIFGMQERAGSVLFFDALPLNGQATFVVDIMNPHYPDYYNTLKSNAITPPANNQSPNPIPFLAVKEGTTFTFALAPRNPNELQHREEVKLVKEWLQKALQKYGVGGKTGAGYGYFQKPTDLAVSSSSVEISTAQYTNPHSSLRGKSSIPQPSVVDPDIRKAEGYIRELDAMRDVAGQIQGYYQKWGQLTSQEARLLLARAIIEKVRKAGREKVTAEKAWYKELQTFLNRN